jgi:hypothetical protein
MFLSFSNIKAKYETKKRQYAHAYAQKWRVPGRSVALGAIDLAVVTSGCVRWFIRNPNRVIAAATVVYVCFALGQWWVMRQQLGVMQAEQRPWVGAPQIHFEKHGDAVDGELRFTNSGKMPTTGLYIYAKLVSEAHWNTTAEYGCAEGTKHFYNSRGKGFQNYTVVPGQDFLLQEGAGFTLRNLSIESLVKFGLPYTGELGVPYISGCTTYRSPFDNVPHHTRFYAPLLIENGSVSAPYVYAINPN